MLRYSEADELSAGGRVVSMRSGATGVTLREPSRRARPRPMLIDLRAADDGPGAHPRAAERGAPAGAPRRRARAAAARPPARRPRAGRPARAGGRALRPADLTLKVILLFAVVGMALLWPTARRGRLVVVPSEGLLVDHRPCRSGPRGHADHHLARAAWNLGGPSTVASIDVLAIVQIVRRHHPADPARSPDHVPSGRPGPFPGLRPRGHAHHRHRPGRASRSPTP